MLSSTKTMYKTAIASSICAILVGCGGGSSGGGDGSSIPVNTAPIVKEVAPIILQALDSKDILISATDKENDTLSYSIKTQPKFGTASIDSQTGKVTYTAGNVIGEDSLVISVSDGKLSSEVTIVINTQAESVFDYQFYKVSNPDTGNYQIVRYDPNNNNEKTNQKVIKSNVILGDHVFVISAAKDGNKSIYKKREYAIFLDPGASSEKRTQTANGTTTEYTFYTNNILKRFDAANPDQEQVIFTSTQLGSKLGGEGLSAIGDALNLYVNETDVDNSYVELRAYAKLPDTLKGELSDTIKNAYVTVRLSDGKMNQGRTIKPVVNSPNGKTEAVLVNYSAAHIAGQYPSTASEAARLQNCTVDLSSCTDLGDVAKGQFYFLAQNDGYIYLAKEGTDQLYAYDKTANKLSKVDGVKYPAKYDVVHHQLKFSGGHGGSGIFSNFYNFTNVVDNLSEGNAGYLLVNYNLDTQKRAGAGSYSSYGMDPFIPKNAQIIKFEGTKATKVYDNGDGVDLGNKSSAVPLSYNLSLTAVKNGHLFVEAAKLQADTMLNYQQGWIDASTAGTVKTKLDNTVVEQNISYFTALRVPAVAVGDDVYVNETNPIASATRVYNIYKLPLNKPTAKPSDAGITHVTGRMYFERTAFRSNGVYEGSVLLWDKNQDGQILNATTNQVMGKALDIDSGVTNVTADASGNTTLAGIGGLFGLHMTSSHGSVPILTSGFSEKAQSLKKVNEIQGSWITD